jgi:RNA polymerase sigma factor (sigma-70 family)
MHFSDNGSTNRLNWLLQSPCSPPLPSDTARLALARTVSNAYHGQCSGERAWFQNWRPSMAIPDVIQPAGDSPETRLSLLVQIRDGKNQLAWQEFVKLYGPVVYGFARKRGLQDADAADLMQEVLRSVSAAIGRLDYDRSQGTFRGWLFTITRNKVFNFLSARRIRPQGSGDTTTNRLLDQHPDSSDGSEAWEAEYQRRLASLAMERVKGEFQANTWEAFRLTAVEGISAADAGQQVGISPGAVYVAKSRVLARLKQEVEAIERQEES